MGDYDDKQGYSMSEIPRRDCSTELTRSLERVWVRSVNRGGCLVCPFSSERKNFTVDVTRLVKRLKSVGRDDYTLFWGSQ